MKKRLISIMMVAILLIAAMPMQVTATAGIVQQNNSSDNIKGEIAPGLFISDYKCEMNGKTANISFTVWNELGKSASVIVFDKDGNERYDQHKICKKYTKGISSVKQWAEGGWQWLTRFPSLFDSSQHFKLLAQDTPVTVQVPENGYILITSDPLYDPYAYILDGLDLIGMSLSATKHVSEVVSAGISWATDTSDPWDFDTNSLGTIFNKDLAEKYQKNVDKVAIEALGKALVDKNTKMDPTQLKTILDLVIKSGGGYDILQGMAKNVLNPKAIVFSVSEELMTKATGPVGAGINTLFAQGDSQNIAAWIEGMRTAIGSGYYRIDNNPDAVDSKIAQSIIGKGSESNILLYLAPMQAHYVLNSKPVFFVITTDEVEQVIFDIDGEERIESDFISRPDGRRVFTTDPWEMTIPGNKTVMAYQSINGQKIVEGHLSTNLYIYEKPVTKQDNNSKIESNNTPETATKIIPNISKKGILSDRNATEWYEFSLEEPGEVVINLSKESIQGRHGASLFKASQNGEIASLDVNGDSRNGSSNTVNLSSGIYRIRVSGAQDWDGSPGGVPYTLTVLYTRNNGYSEIEPNDTPETATKITPNVSVNGILNSREGIDWYEFSLEESGEVMISLTKESIQGRHGASLFKFSQNGEVASLDVNGDSTNGSSNTVNLSSGIYRVRVSGAQDWDGSPSGVPYTLTVLYTRNNGNSEIEPNDTSETATKITPNIPMNGILNSREGVDWYEFSLEGSGEVTISLIKKGVRGVHSVSLFKNPQDKGIGSFTVDGSNKNGSSGIINLEGGTYKIRVTGAQDWDGTPGGIPYMLTVTSDVGITITNPPSPTPAPQPTQMPKPTSVPTPTPAKTPLDTLNKVSFGGHQYAIVDKSMTWKEAKAYCESLGGHLATIVNSEENEFIVSLIKNSGKYAFWIGATDENSEGSFKWVTGEVLSYKNWSKGEPNNYQGLEHYVAIIVKDAVYKLGEWNDFANNGSSSGFICEWDNSSTTTSTPTPKSLTDKTITVETEKPILSTTSTPNIQYTITFAQDAIGLSTSLTVTAGDSITLPSPPYFEGNEAYICYYTYRDLHYEDKVAGKSGDKFTPTHDTILYRKFESQN